MRQIISKNTKINFSGKFPLTSLLSGLLVIIALSLVVTRGLNYGVDFKGGAEIQVQFAKPIELAKLRGLLKEKGLDGAQVQSIGDAEENEFLLKVQAEDGQLNSVSNQLAQLLTTEFAGQGATIRKTDIVGPKAGHELRMSGFKAMFYAVLAIMIYIGLRFDFKYSPGAIVALIHDVLIVLGIFSLTDRPFTLQIVAALLAVIGYSVNDTVVIYDRVREHEDRNPESSLRGHIDRAANETLSRTLLTSGTTLFVCLSMLFMGGQSIHDFFFAITLGVLIGTYSSIFVAAPVTLFCSRFQKPKEEEAGPVVDA